MEVFNQVREANVGGNDVSEYDLDVTVTNPSEDAMTFKLKIYNFNEDTFQSINSGESGCEIMLGWENGPASPVIVGVVEETSVEQKQNDKVYTITGQDETARALSSRVSKNYYQQPPDAIAADLASQVGLGSKTEGVGTPIDGYYSVQDNRPVEYWLNELLDYAGNFTGDSWTVRAKEGKLYFTTDSATPETVPELSYDSTLASIQPKESQNESAPSYEFTAALDPRIKQGAQVAVSTEKYSGNFEVLSYEYSSSDISGDHLVKGTVRQLGSPESYSSRQSRRGRGGEASR